jgi:hypothetical protein
MQHFTVFGGFFSINFKKGPKLITEVEKKVTFGKLIGAEFRILFFDVIKN